MGILFWVTVVIVRVRIIGIRSYRVTFGFGSVRYGWGGIGGLVAEWLACCWTRAQKGLGSNRSRDAVE